MDEKFQWQANITFTGYAKEFNKLTELLEKYRVTVEIPEYRGGVAVGGMRVPVKKLISEERLNALTKDMPVIDIRFIRDIRGGIRTPHLHLDDKVVLLDKERFIEFAGEVAQHLAEIRAARIEDYVEVMQPIGEIAPSI
jgi:hypothetical protein